MGKGKLRALQLFQTALSLLTPALLRANGERQLRQRGAHRLLLLFQRRQPCAAVCQPRLFFQISAVGVRQLAKLPLLLLAPRRFPLQRAQLFHQRLFLLPQRLQVRLRLHEGGGERRAYIF